MDQQDLQELKRAIQDSIAAGFRDATLSRGRGNTNTPSAPSGDGSRLSNILKGTGNDLSSAVGNFVGVLERGNGNITNFGEAIGNLSEALDVKLTKYLPKVGGFLGSAFKVLGASAEGVSAMLQDQANMYRYLSKVGGGFNGDLSQLRLQAGEARLSLRDYAEIVANNSQTLSMFAGGVDGGAKAVADLGRTMFDSGVIDRLQNLGMTIAEANEFVVQNIALSRRQDILTKRSTEDQLLAAAELAQSMTVMSKLTGKQSKEIQNDLERRQRAGAQIGALRMLEANGVENAQEAYKKVQTGLAGAPTVLKDLMDDIIRLGVPVGEATKNFAATNHEAYELAQQAAAALKAGDVEQAEKLSQQATAAALKFAKSREGAYLASMAGISDVGQTQADALAEVDPLITQIESKIGATGDIIEGFNNVVAEMTLKVQNTMSGLGENQGSYAIVREFEQQFAILSGEFQKILGEGQSTEAFNDTLNSFAQQLNRFQAPELVEALKKQVNALIGKAQVLAEKEPAAIGMSTLETLMERGLSIELPTANNPTATMTPKDIYAELKKYNETQDPDDKSKLLKDLVDKNILTMEGELSDALREGIYELQKNDSAAVDAERAAGKRIDATTIIDDAISVVTDITDSITEQISTALNNWGNKFTTFINEEMGLNTLMEKLTGFNNDFQKWYDDQYKIITNFYDKVEAKVTEIETWWNNLDLNPFSQNIQPKSPTVMPAMQQNIQPIKEAPIAQTAMYQPQNIQSIEEAPMAQTAMYQSQDFQPNASLSNDMAQKLFQELLMTGQPMSQETQTFAAENQALLTQLKDMAKSGVTDIKQYSGESSGEDLNKLVDTWTGNFNEIVEKMEQLIKNHSNNNSVDMTQVVQKLTDLNTNLREVVELNTKSNNMTKKNLDYNRESSMYA